MIIFFIIIVMSIAGIGVTFWLISSEQKLAKGIDEKKISQEFGETGLRLDIPSETIESTPEKPLKKKFNLSEKLAFLKKIPLSFKKKNKEDDISIKPASKPPKSIAHFIDKFREKILSLRKVLISKKKNQKENPVIESKPFSSLQDSLALTSKEKIEPLVQENDHQEGDERYNLTEVDPNVEKELELSFKLNEWKEKYERLDKLFIEKSTELDKTKTDFENELKNQKDFNKVKDILEKELKETKDRTKEVQNELNSLQGEKESIEKQIQPLEDKIKQLEEELIQIKRGSDSMVTEENIEPITIQEEEPLNQKELQKTPEFLSNLSGEILEQKDVSKDADKIDNKEEKKSTPESQSQEESNNNTEQM